MSVLLDSSAKYLTASTSVPESSWRLITAFVKIPTAETLGSVNDAVLLSVSAAASQFYLGVGCSSAGNGNARAAAGSSEFVYSSGGAIGRDQWKLIAAAVSPKATGNQTVAAWMEGATDSYSGLSGLTQAGRIFDAIRINGTGGGRSQCQEYDVAADTWTTLGPIGYISSNGSAVDPIRNRILVVSGSAPRIFDISAGSLLSVEWGGLGASAVQSLYYPGAVYDEANDDFLVALNLDGVIELFRIDPETNAITAPDVSGTKPSARPTGIHNAVQYVPELRGIVLANKHTQNVKFMRTA